MRRTKRIVTKDHLLIYTVAFEKNDEIWTRESLFNKFTIKTSNAIFVFSSGNVGIFTNDGSDWNKHTNAIEPIMYIRPERDTGKTCNGWAMVNNENTKGSFSAILLREDYDTGHIKAMAGANTQEVFAISSNPEQTFTLNEQCIARQKRDLSTLDMIDLIKDIELDIDWGSYSNT